MRFKTRLLLLIFCLYIAACFFLARSLFFQGIDHNNHLVHELRYMPETEQAMKERVGNAFERDILNMQNLSFDRIAWNSSFDMLGPRDSYQALDSLKKPWSVVDDNRLFHAWARNVTAACEGRFVIYSNTLVYLRHSVLSRKHAFCQAAGGEDPQTVINRPAEDEEYTFTKGFFQVLCDKRPIFRFLSNSIYLNTWLATTLFHSSPVTDYKEPIFRYEGFTIALTRMEYANVYWTMMDLYDVFLTMRMFNQLPKTTTILLVDAKPRGHLDALWTSSFSSVMRLSNLPQLTHFDSLVWNSARTHSPMLIQQTSIPLVPEFRQFLLGALNLSVSHTRECSSMKLNVMFVWRRDYVAHPRNPAGIISRKIKNEDELINATRIAFPSYRIMGVQLDKLEIRHQLNVISQTDIMIGMHGAAFGYGFILPPGSGAIEMYPLGANENWHMEYIAKWSRVHYIRYRNTKKRNEDYTNKFTYIPPKDTVALISKMATRICSASDSKRRKHKQIADTIKRLKP